MLGLLLQARLHQGVRKCCVLPEACTKSLHITTSGHFSRINMMDGATALAEVEQCWQLLPVVCKQVRQQ